MSKFHSRWEAKILEEHVIASGVWHYQNELPYSIQLIKQLWNYTSADLSLLDELLEVPFSDYIDFNISDEGVIFFWRFDSPKNEKNVSSTFSTEVQARKHLDTYGYNYKLHSD